MIGCTRLEELILDGTDLNTNDSKDVVFRIISGLQNLRILNLCGTALEEDSEKVLGLLHYDALLEQEDRNHLFFRAVIANDLEKVYLYIDSGQDLNIKAGSFANSMLLDVWINKCDSSTVFFDCNHEDESFHPTAVHIAIFLNHKEVLAALVFAGAETEAANVWFSHVHRIDGILQYDEEKAVLEAGIKRADDPSYTLTTLYSPSALIDRCFELNIHRVVGRMKQNKIMNWKELCVYSNKKMSAIVNRTIDTDRELFASVPQPSTTHTKTIFTDAIGRGRHGDSIENDEEEGDGNEDIVGGGESNMLDNFVANNDFHENSVGSANGNFINRRRVDTGGSDITFNSSMMSAASAMPTKRTNRRELFLFEGELPWRQRGVIIII